MHLALADVAALRFVDVFDRVLERENVVLAVAIDEIEQSRQSRGFSRANGTSDEDESVVVAGERQDVFGRQADFLDGADFGIDDPEDHIEAKALTDDRGAKSAFTVIVSKIDIALFLQSFPFGFTEERLGQFESVLSGERRVVIPDRQQLADPAPSGRKSCGEVNIRGTILLAEA